MPLSIVTRYPAVFVFQCLAACATVPRECHDCCCCDAAPEAEQLQRDVEC